MTNPFAISVRLLKAIDLLASTNGATIKGLENKLGISRRSVFRLLQALEELGFPITDNQTQPKAEKIYHLLDSYVLKLPNISIPNPYLTPDEMLFLLAILETNKKYNLLTDVPLLYSVREKLYAMLPEIKRKHIT